MTVVVVVRAQFGRSTAWQIAYTHVDNLLKQRWEKSLQHFLPLCYSLPATTERKLAQTYFFNPRLPQRDCVVSLFAAVLYWMSPSVNEGKCAADLRERQCEPLIGGPSSDSFDKAVNFLICSQWARPATALTSATSTAPSHQQRHQQQQLTLIYWLLKLSMRSKLMVANMAAIWHLAMLKQKSSSLCGLPVSNENREKICDSFFSGSRSSTLFCSKKYGLIHLYCSKKEAMRQIGCGGYNYYEICLSFSGNKLAAAALFVIKIDPKVADN